MADRTHSHDTSTPAVSAETVPSEEFVRVPREPTHEMKEAGARENQGMYPIAIYRAMIAAAPAPNPSPAAKGGDAVRDHAWWLAVAKAAGEAGVRYRTNRALCEFLGAVAALSTPTEGPASQTAIPAASHDGQAQPRSLRE